MILNSSLRSRDRRPSPLSPRPHRRAPDLALAAIAALLLVLPLAACGGGQKSNANAATQLSFGVNMARRGLWQEALFRFREAERLDPRNPHVENNLGVAYEAAGDFDHALEYYKKAITLAPESREVKANYTRFVEFYQGFRAKQGKPGGASPTKITQNTKGRPAVAPPEPPAGSPNEPPAPGPLFPDQPPTRGVGEPTAPGPPPPSP
jgi:tetratricopeptide (TPR) repeat protein